MCGSGAALTKMLVWVGDGIRSAAGVAKCGVAEMPGVRFVEIYCAIGAIFLVGAGTRIGRAAPCADVRKSNDFARRFVGLVLFRAAPPPIFLRTFRGAGRGPRAIYHKFRAAHRTDCGFGRSLRLGLISFCCTVGAKSLRPGPYGVWFAAKLAKVRRADLPGRLGTWEIVGFAMIGGALPLGCADCAIERARPVRLIGAAALLARAGKQCPVHG